MADSRLAQALIDRIPRPVELLPEPTPLYRLPRVSDELGREIWVKRDDLTAVGVGGNKIRKLEYLLGEATEQNADVLVTVGAGQSNHCRAVASAARVMGMDCHLVLGGTDPGERSGNLLLDDLLGASLEFCGTDDWASIFAAAEATCEGLRAQGKTPYLMPAGGSTPLGAYGYIRAYAEYVAQAEHHGLSAGSIVFANGSGGTQAGLIAGKALLGGDTEIIGVAVALEASLMAPVSDGLADAALAMLDTEAVPRNPATVLDGYRGPTYGVPTEAGQAALKLVLQREGILMDPVYSAKAFSAITAGDSAIPDGPVVFWHTGGSPAVFASAH